MNYKLRKAGDLFAAALKEARLQRVSRPVDRRTKSDRKLTAQGWRRVAVYYSPQEFRELKTLAESEGVGLSVVARALLHLLVEVED